MNKEIIFMALLLISFKAFSQRPSTGCWVNVQIPVQLNSKWQIHNEAGYRTLGNTTAALQYLYRPGIRYSINKKWNAAAGAAFFYTRTSFTKQNDEFAKEFRFWQEAVYKMELTKNLQWQTRLRTEQRYFSATAGKAAYQAFRYRIKPQFLQTLSDKWTLSLANEYMQQYANNKWSFDQNRVIVNGNYFFNTHTQLQAGYMWLRWPAHSSQHIITLTFLKTISLHAKQ